MQKDASQHLTLNKNKIEEKKLLLTFAHKGEASAFFKNFQLNKVEELPNQLKIEGLWSHKSDSLSFWLLITGEGRQRSFEKTVLFLSCYHQQVSEILNLGVCGSLCDNLVHNSIIQIRTCYHESEFHSYTTEEGEKSRKGIFDVVSTDRRVLSNAEKEKLIPIAHVVDREAWSVSRASQIFNISFNSIKTISDSSDSSEICQIVKEKAEVYSETLLNEFLKNSSKKKFKKILNDIDFLRNKSFHCTFTQRKKILKLHKILKIKDKVKDFNQAVFKVESLKNIKAKDKTKKLIDLLEEIASPKKTHLLKQLNSLSHFYKRNGINIHFDKELEKNDVFFSFSTSSKEDLSIKTLKLRDFPWMQVTKLFEGTASEIDISKFEVKNEK